VIRSVHRRTRAEALVQVTLRRTWDMGSFVIVLKFLLFCTNKRSYSGGELINLDCFSNVSSLTMNFKHNFNRNMVKTR